MKKTTHFLRTMLGLCCIAGLSAHAQTITVTNTNDSGPGSLRQAVADISAGGTIGFDGSLNGNTISLESAIEIEKNITITGNGEDNTIISGNDETQIFVITDADVELSDLTLTEGNSSQNGGGIWASGSMVTVADVTISDCEAHGSLTGEGGGAIYIEDGELNMSGSAVLDSRASGISGSGGGILVGADGMLTISDSEISGNFANRAGGGIEVSSDNDMLAVTLENVTLEANATGNNPGNGGGLHVTGNGDVSISGSVIKDNTGAQGGGLWNHGGTMTIASTEFEGNTAFGLTVNDGGGAIYNSGGTLHVSTSTLVGNRASGLLSRGGGIHNNGGAATVLVTTISGNTSLTNGGGIFNNGNLTINSNTITQNSATLSGGGISNEGDNEMSLKNTLVASNTAILSGADLFTNGNEIDSEGFNLIGMADGGIFLGTEDDLVGSIETAIEVGLMALADNGGGTRTHRLVCPSPAADMGDPDDTSEDQAGQGVYNGRRDIGAYEEQQMCGLVNSTDDFALATSMVYPNPALNGRFSLQLSQAHSTGASLYIYEIGTGKLVKELDAVAGTMEISMDDAAAGTYVVQVVSDNATETHKLVIGGR